MTRKYYSIIPAAGSSRRMGQPKLLMPWPSKSMPDGTVIDQVLSVWTSSRVSETVVVIRKDDELLQAACERWPVSIVQPTNSPVDMKASIQCGLRFLQSNRNPSSSDWCFISPADLPTLRAEFIKRMVNANVSDSIMVASFAGKRCHPALLPWHITDEIFNLADDEGVNAIIDRHLAVEVPIEEDVADIDTPDDYKRAFREER